MADGAPRTPADSDGTPVNAVIQHLTTRRSVPARALTEPGPSASELATILHAAVRVPDHGKLTPWLLHLVVGEAQSALGDIVAAAFHDDHPEAKDTMLAAERLRTSTSPVLIIVSTRFRTNERFPECEQYASTAAVCMNLLHASHALGYGAQWVTGWPAYHPQVRAAFGVGSDDHIVGWIHVGSPTIRPADRVRPALSEIATWWQPPSNSDSGTADLPPRAVSTDAEPHVARRS
jgi:nitroreductase